MYLLRDKLELKARMPRMSDDVSSDIDPRFDPAFQRGFDHEAPVTQAPAARQPVIQPLAAAQPIAHVQPNGHSTVAPAPVEEPVATLDADETANATEASPLAGRNPYLLLLAVVAVILVAVGIWLFTQSGAQFDSREVRSQGDYVSLDATIHAAPFVSLLGAATAIGVVFVFAAQWRKRR
jgi:hypothetical protein